MSKSTQFIDGIFNYCDRWCERCAMTKHCRVFVTEEAVQAASKDELEKKEFWEKLDEQLGYTVHQTNKWIEEMLPSEPPSEEEMEEYQREEEWANLLIESADLMQAATAYRVAADAWLEGHEDLHKAASRRMQNKDVPHDSDERAVDAVSIAAWYQYQISAKLHRALRGKREDEWGDDRIQNDWNGSARVALLGLERSMTAWSILRDLIPDECDAIVRLLARCGLIRRMLLQEFPDVRQFVRPGFDDR